MQQLILKLKIKLKARKIWTLVLWAFMSRKYPEARRLKNYREDCIMIHNGVKQNRRASSRRDIRQIANGRQIHDYAYIKDGILTVTFNVLVDGGKQTFYDVI
jgi:hypothetical protein